MVQSRLMAFMLAPRRSEIDMFSQTLTIKLVFALLLAMIVAWGGHAAAWLTNSSHPAFEPTDHHHHQHESAVGEQVNACVLCQLQHEHSPLSADHLHETPYPTSLIKVHTLAERSQPLVAPRHFLPASPVFLIERPPRPSFVL